MAIKTHYPTSNPSQIPDKSKPALKANTQASTYPTAKLIETLAIAVRFCKLMPLAIPIKMP